MDAAIRDIAYISFAALLNTHPAAANKSTTDLLR
jgi:hypothetical protein